MNRNTAVFSSARGIRMEDQSYEEYLARRTFLKQLGAASAAALTCGATRTWGNTEAVIQPEARADSCILIWLAGGMAAPDTFDPKRYFPFTTCSPLSLSLSLLLLNAPISIDTLCNYVLCTQLALENNVQKKRRKKKPSKKTSN